MSKDNIFTYTPTPAVQGQIASINGILSEYGVRLTLRQLYYQLVARDIIPNHQRQYKRLSEITTKARKAGLISFESLDDRLRKPMLPYWVTGVPKAISDTISQYRLDRMKGQDRYIEVWCEKDSVSNILSPVCNEYHIRLMINRGYSSITAMWEASGRFRNKPDPLILYLGDHDPSGLDMVRDIDARLRMFSTPVEVEHIALTMDQVEELNPPPNPAKITDPRADMYILEHGDKSWELDAIPPDEMETVLTDAIMGNIDTDKYEAVLEKEEVDKTELSKIINK